MEYLIYWIFFEFIGCSIARVVIPAVSFGRAYVHPFNAPVIGFNWLGWRRDENGRIVIARDVAGFMGFMIIVVLFLVFVLAARPF